MAITEMPDEVRNKILSLLPSFYDYLKLNNIDTDLMAAMFFCWYGQQFINAGVSEEDVDMATFSVQNIYSELGDKKNPWLS